MLSFSGMKSEHFAYQRESVLGVLDWYPTTTRVRVTIPGHGTSEMTIGELSRQVERLRAEDMGEGRIENIRVNIIDA